VGRFTPQVLGPDLALDALRNCLSLATTRLVNAESRWLVFKDVDMAAPWDLETGADRFDDLVTSLRSLSLDLQIRAIHQGATLNASYLMTSLADSNPGMPSAGLPRMSPADWRAQLLLSAPLIEYSDDFFFNGEDLDEVYTPDNPIRRFHLYKRLQHPGDQLLGHIQRSNAPHPVRGLHPQPDPA
jgi:hypothetical protein